MAQQIKGLAALLRKFQRVQETAPLAAATMTRDQARELLARARAVAPRLTGKLERSGKVTGLDSGGRSTWVVSFDTPYAVIRHEDFYNLGPVSINKAGTEDGPVGRKYLERPYIRMAPEIQAKIASAVLASVKKA